MLEQQIKLIESYLNYEDVEPAALLDASDKVFHASFALRCFVCAFDAAYLEDKEEAAAKFKEFNDSVEEYGL